MRLAAAMICCAAFLGLAAPQARAQVTRIHATVESFSGTTMSLLTTGGDKLDVTVPQGVPVRLIVPAKLSEIGSGSYVGTAAMPGPNGTLRAMEVHIFPEASRGAGDGTRPWDQPQSLMVNGTVGDVTVKDGDTLVIKNHDGEKTVTVSPNTPIITFAPGSRDLLVAGAHVTVTANKGPDGELTATGVAVGKDGMVPPI
jgi:hypothetical protein